MPKTDRMAALRAASRTEEATRFDDAASQMVAARERPGLTMLPIDQVQPNPDQPRRAFDRAALEELAASIREVGILQPVLVRRATGGGYELIAGERRWRASKLAGLERIPATIRALDDNETLEASLTENLQREDLSPLEEAQIFQRMIDELDYSIRRLAERLGKGKGYIEDRLRLTRMDSMLQELVSERPDTLTHAREIDKVQEPKLREELIRDVEAGRPLQEIRKRIRQAQAPPAPSAASAPREPARETTLSAESGSASPDLVSGRPDTFSQAESIEQSLLDSTRYLRRQLETVEITAAPELRKPLIAELQATAAAIQDLLARLQAPDFGRQPEKRKAHEST